MLNTLISFESVQIDDAESQTDHIDVFVEPTKDRVRKCIDCGEDYDYVAGKTERTFRDLSVYGSEMRIICPVRKIYCPSCEMIRPDDLGFYWKGIEPTKRFTRYMYDLSEDVDLSNVDASDHLGFSWHSIDKYVNRYKEQELEKSGNKCEEVITVNGRTLRMTKQEEDTIQYKLSDTIVIGIDLLGHPEHKPRIVAVSFDTGRVIKDTRIIRESIQANMKSWSGFWEENTGKKLEDFIYVPMAGSSYLVHELRGAVGQENIIGMQEIFPD